jgi:potassium-transporting ATPase KdpC subunit
MRKNLISSLLAVLTFTVLFGLAYPLVVTGIAQVAFPGKADGDPTLLARDVKGSPRYFHPRPSATEYSSTATFFANRGPNQSSARFFYRDALAAYVELEGPYTPGLSTTKVPADAVTMSGSGVDPHISEANARIQARRVAAVRGLSPGRVAALIADSEEGGVFGPRVVNTTKLNEALDR